MTKEEYIEYCRTIPGAAVDQPFEEDFTSFIARHADTRRWFAAILEHDGKKFVNLKCEPLEADFLRSVFKGVEPGYHMNKTHWNSVCFDSDVSDDLLKQMTMNSFRLTEAKKKRRNGENTAK